MNYKDLKNGHIFTFTDHPENDIFIKLEIGFVRIPNKFCSSPLSNNTDGNRRIGPFPDSNKDVRLLTKKEIYKSIVLRKKS